MLYPCPSEDPVFITTVISGLTIVSTQICAEKVTAVESFEAMCL